MRVEDHAPEPLQWCQGELSGRAACEIPLNVILAEVWTRVLGRFQSLRASRSPVMSVVVVGDRLRKYEGPPVVWQAAHE